MRFPLRALEGNQFIKPLIDAPLLTRATALPAARTNAIDAMLIAHVRKIPDLALGQEHRHAERVHGRVAPSLVEESPAAIQPREIFFMSPSSSSPIPPPPKPQTPNLKIAKELTIIILAILQQPRQIRLGMKEMRVRSRKRPRFTPERREGACVVEDVHVESVFELVVAHEAEDVVVDVAEEVDLRGKRDGEVR
ncbi:hypothetical protein NHQ30_009084 [Ciborinia camelliae]|nr:hypothetical protein NHQ30_009084 [Ciborinia camelliae]